MSGRFCVEVHAYCLMTNHYHLLIRTPEANASRAIQWLNVSYAAWVNAKRDRAGHLFQGRFNSVLIDNRGAWLLLASQYLHLNPVRTVAMGLGKSNANAERTGYRIPEDKQIVQRIENLREFRWSSYPVYAGFAGKPQWLHTSVILERIGGRGRYRKAVETYLTCGANPKDFECLSGRVALGSARFVEQARKLVLKVTGEHSEHRFVEHFVSFESIVKVVEKEAGSSWSEFSKERGGVYRNLVFYLAQQRSGLTLLEIGTKTGFDYKLVGKGARKIAALLSKDKVLRDTIARSLTALAKSEM